MGFLELFFEPNDVLRILFLPVGSMENDDELLWSHSRNGHYGVLSGYREALATKDLVEALDPKESKALWKFIWILNVPPKVKLFTWRMCKKGLPMHYNLSKKGMSVNSFCFRCALARELVCHCLWNCPFVKPVW